MQIDKIKDLFRDIYCRDIQIQDNAPVHFNFPKWYKIIYYPKFIHFFESTVKYTTRIRKA